MPGRRLRLVLAEDAALLREGLVGILEKAGHEVVAAVGDADALLAYTAHARPDAVITDIRMPPDHGDEGLRAAAAIRAEQPDVAIMVLSAYVADAYVAELLDSAPGGGIGYLLKDRVGHVRSSWTASTGWPPARPWSTRRWSASCSAAAATTVPSAR